MLKAKEKKVCESALCAFGIDGQIDMMDEEMHELGVALGHYKRGRARDEEVITEIADVMIMAQQLALFFGEEDVEAEIARKIQRLSERIECKRAGQ